MNIVISLWTLLWHNKLNIKTKHSYFKHHPSTEWNNDDLHIKSIIIKSTLTWFSVGFLLWNKRWWFFCERKFQSEFWKLIKLANSYKTKKNPLIKRKLFYLISNEEIFKYIYGKNLKKLVTYMRYKNSHLQWRIYS